MRALIGGMRQAQRNRAGGIVDGMPMSKESVEVIPTVSVIVPVFNQRRFLAETAACLAGQSWRSVEIIYVDDGSTDGSSEFLDTLAEDRTRVIHQSNRGPSAARNAGLRLAEGDFVQFLDGDDLISADKLAHDVGFLQSHPGYDLVSCEVSYFRESVENRRPADWAVAFGDLLSALLGGNVLMIHAPLMRRDAAERAGEFDEDIAGCEDWDYWLGLAACGIRGRFVSGIRAFCRQHEGQSSHDGWRMLKGARKVLKKAREMPGARQGDATFLFAIAGAHAEWSLHAARAGDGHLASEFCEPIADWIASIPEGLVHPEYDAARALMMWANVMLAIGEDGCGFERAVKEWNHAATFVGSEPTRVGVRALLECQGSFVRSGGAQLEESAKSAGLCAKECWVAVGRNKTAKRKARNDWSHCREVEGAVAAMRADNVRRLLIYGAGAYTRLVLSEFTLSRLEIVGIMDDDARLWGTSLLDIPILAPKSARAVECDAVLICSDRHEKRLAERARRIFPVTRVYGTIDRPLAEPASPSV